MSYFNFYCENILKSSCTNVDTITGTCNSMCPQEEVAMREKEKLVHILEVYDSKRILIKCYSRSAADTKVAVPHLLRPYRVLVDTVKYLLIQIPKRQDVPETVIYDFITDRLRAVRQDMIIQRLPPQECVSLLEPMIRFHVYYAYKFYGYPMSNYDPKLNNNYLLECLKWFLSCYDSVDMHDKVMNDLCETMTSLDLSHDFNLTCDRVLMESLYILCNLNDVHPLLRYLSLPKDLQRNATLNIAYEIGISNIKRNYIKVGKLMRKLCPLSYCAMVVYLPIVQRQALQVMATAYNSKQLTVPVPVLRQWLQFQDYESVMSSCKHYGLEIDREAVHLNKSTFKADVPIYQPKKLHLRGINDLKLDYILTYKT